LTSPRTSNRSKEIIMSAVPQQDRLAGTWSFAPAHSSAAFSVRYVVAAFRGSFDEVTATLVDGKLTGAVEVGSVDVNHDDLAAHLMTADFFDADNHPVISFTSKEMTITGDDVELHGELTMKGVTNALYATGTIEGPTEDFMGQTRLGFTLTTTIDRRAFGVSWNAELPKGGPALSDDVELTVELEFTQAV
jgi:polyisoprenoid-binding protein YceI